MSATTNFAPRLETSFMANQTPIVFIVDDDVSVRESVEALVEELGWQPKTFDSAQAFLAHPPPTAPNCLVLDVSLPDLNGLEVQRSIAGERGDMPIIFITGHGDIPMSVLAMKAGAIEFLTKPFANEVLLTAIRGALERSQITLNEQSSMRALKDRYDSLSRREREVMSLVVRGLLNKQVAGTLGISEITVKAHRGQVMRKMRARSLPELVSLAARLGLETAGNS